MRYKLLIWSVIALLSFMAGAGELSCVRHGTTSRGLGTKWYVATTGSDTDGDGSLAHPWKTLKHACDTVTGAAFATDTIMIGAGTFVEPDRINLSTGVSIKGAGITSKIVSTYAPAANYQEGSIYLNSVGEGTNGNQSISHIWLDGSAQTAHYAIGVHDRSNVKIHDCTITDFDYRGIYIGQGTSFGAVPTIYSTGNEVYNCIITNCSSRISGEGNGLLAISGQEGLLIHNNIFDQTARATGENGNIIDAVEGYNKGLEYSYNTSYKPLGNGSIYNFHLEFWTSRGGMNIHHNTFYNGFQIDCGGVNNTVGEYDYAWWIHDNNFYQVAQCAEADMGSASYSRGIDFEGTNEYSIVERNHFKNIALGVTFDLSQNNRYIRGIHLRYNILENMGLTDIGFTFPFQMTINTNVLLTNCIMEDISFDNNIINGNFRGAFFIGPSNANDTIKNVRIRNNIVEGSNSYGWLAFWNTGGNIDSISVQNNLLYDNVSSNAIFYYSGRTVATIINTGNILGSAPLFKSTFNFSLRPTSPAINAALDVGYTSDYHGHRVPLYGLPDIGAFEFGVYPMKNHSGSLLRNTGGSALRKY